MSSIAMGEQLLAGLLLVSGVLAAGPLSTLLAAASWPSRAPGPALVLWQTLCLAAGLSVVGSFVVIAVSGWGGNLLQALMYGWNQVRAGQWPRGLGPTNIGSGVVAIAIAGYLLVVLVLTTISTLHRRRRHRRTLDLISDRSSGVHVLDSTRPVAYSLPGIKPRVVLSAGLLATLGDDEARAAIEHERAHLRVRHDLLLLPFGAWARALRWVPGVRQGRLAVAELAEMHADDVAVRRVSPKVLAAALAAIVMAGGPQTAGAAGQDSSPSAVQDSSPAAEATQELHSASVGAISARIRRLLDPDPLEPVRRAGIYLMALALLTIPTWLLLVGWK